MNIGPTQGNAWVNLHPVANDDPRMDDYPKPAVLQQEILPDPDRARDLGSQQLERQVSQAADPGLPTGVDE